MLKKFVLIVSVLTCFIPYYSAAVAEESDLRVAGSIITYFIAIDPGDIEGGLRDDDSLDGIMQNRLRLKTVWDPAGRVRAELAYDLKPVIQEDAGSFSFSGVPEPRLLSYRVADLGRIVYSKNDVSESAFVLSQNLDRAFLTFSPDFGDIYVGRQPVAFGSARVINPTDVLAPFTFDELDVEDRIGVDAVRAKIPIGMLSEFDAGAVFGEDFETDKSAVFVRTKFYVAETDITLIAMDFRDNLLGGIDVVRSIGGAGVWLEGAYTFVGMFDDRDTDQDFLRVSTGIDYFFDIAGGLTAFIEYHYNGASEGKPEEYINQTDKTAYQEAGVYLLGQHYVTPGMAWQIRPLVALSGSVLWNVEDGSAYLSALIEYNAAEDLYLGIGAGISAGEESSTLIDDASGEISLAPKSEFGLYPSLYYTYIRFYF